MLRKDGSKERRRWWLKEGNNIGLIKVSKDKDAEQHLKCKVFSIWISTLISVLTRQARVHHLDFFECSKSSSSYIILSRRTWMHFPGASCMIFTAQRGVSPKYTRWRLALSTIGAEFPANAK